MPSAGRQLATCQIKVDSCGNLPKRDGIVVKLRAGRGVVPQNNRVNVVKLRAGRGVVPQNNRVNVGK